ncbi:MAG: delta-60 repeat domain-containing protein [Verrucomicrobia bacterium]|nr:delta-60 repeat domain-containing protein [Verrucomicrobiota bacterium]
MTPAARIRSLARLVLAPLAFSPPALRAQAWLLDPAARPAIYQEAPALSGASFTPLSDGRVLAYGAFSHADGRAVPGLALVRANGVTEPAFAAENSATDRVTAAAPLTDARFLAVTSKAPPVAIPYFYSNGDIAVTPIIDPGIVSRGDTVSIRGSPSNLVRLLADGRRDPAFTPLACDGGPNLTPLPDGRVLVWGSYRTLGGAPRNSLARLNADGSLDPAYLPSLAAVPVVIANLAVGTDSSAVVSGFYYDADFRITYFFKRLNSDGSVDPQFVPARITSTFEQLAVQADGRVLAGSGPLARYTPTGTVDPTYNVRVPTRNNGITRIAPLPNSHLAVQSYYTTPAGYALTGVFILGPDGELERDFQAEPGAPNSHRLLAAFPDGRLLLLRSSATLAVTYGEPISATDPAVASAATATAASTGATISTVVPIYVEPTETAQSLAVATDPRSPAVPFGFSPTLRSTAYITRLDADDRGRVYASGNFTHVEGQPRPGFARFLASGAFDPSFAPPSAALQLVLPDGRVIVRQSGKLTRLRDDGTVDSGFSVPAALDKDTTRVLTAAPDGSPVGAGRLLLSVLEPNTSSEASLKLVWLGPGGERLTTLPTVFGGFGYWTYTYLINPGPIIPITPVIPTPGGGTSSTTVPATATAATADITTAAVAVAAGAATATASAGATTANIPVITTPVANPQPATPVTPIVPVTLKFVATNAINAARLLPDGRLLITGSFRSVGATAVRDGVATVTVGSNTIAGVAWLTADGWPVPINSSPPPTMPATDATSLGVSSAISSPISIPLPDGTALVFDTVVDRGLGRTRARRLRDDGTFDPQFAPALGSLPTATRVLSDGSFFVNGRRLLPSSALDLNFAPSATVGTVAAPLAAAAITHAGHLWIAGYFDTLDGQPRASLARYESREIVGFTFVPTAQTLVTGRTATFTSVLGTNQPATFRWTLNGATVPGATDATLVLANTSAASAGDYRAIATIAGREIASPPATLTLTPNTSRLVNFSARGAVAPNSPLITGFVGADVPPRPVLVRALGRGLPVSGVATGTFAISFASWVLPDPVLTLYRGSTKIGEDRGGAASRAAAVLGLAVGATPVRTFASLPLTINYGSALWPSLGAGAYTAVIGSGDGGSGVIILELFDSAASPAPALVRNFSVRGRTAPGTDVLTAGFVVAGNGPRRLLIRGLGPALGGFGIGGAIAEVRLHVFSSAASAPIAFNFGWADDPALAAAARGAQAFALPAGSGDAALLLTLEPGAYTAQLSGAGSAAGNAMIELYLVEN